MKNNEQLKTQIKEI